MRSLESANLPHNTSSYTVLLALNFDTQTLNHMVLLSMIGTPLPPSMDELIDWMQHWGKSISQHWYQETLNWIAFFCDKGMDVSVREIKFKVISSKVREQIHLSLLSTNLLGWTVFNEWLV